jgi:hypothetical protein
MGGCKHRRQHFDVPQRRTRHGHGVGVQHHKVGPLARANRADLILATHDPLPHPRSPLQVRMPGESLGFQALGATDGLAFAGGPHQREGRQGRHGGIGVERQRHAVALQRPSRVICAARSGPSQSPE